MNRTALLKRISALESRKATAFKPPAPILYGSVAVAIIAYRGKRKVRDGLLASYARACRYKGGVSEMLAATPDVFAKKHLRQKPPWSAPENVADAHRYVLSYIEPTGPVEPTPAVAAFLQECRDKAERLRAEV
jgi:hypothetical protein